MYGHWQFSQTGRLAASKSCSSASASATGSAPAPHEGLLAQHREAGVARETQQPGVSLGGRQDRDGVERLAGEHGLRVEVGLRFDPGKTGELAGGFVGRGVGGRDVGRHACARGHEVAGHERPQPLTRPTRTDQADARRCQETTSPSTSWYSAA